MLKSDATGTTKVDSPSSSTTWPLSLVPGIAHSIADVLLDRGPVRASRFQFGVGIAAPAVVHVRNLLPIDAFHQAGVRPRAFHARRRRKQAQARARAGGYGCQHARYLQL